MPEIFIKIKKLPVDADPKAVKEWIDGRAEVKGVEVGENYVRLKGDIPEGDDLPSFLKKVAEPKCRLTSLRGVDRVACWKGNKIVSNEIF